MRKITITATGQMELNGRILHLRGVNLHEQNITTGAALTTPQLDALVGWTRELGATIIRAHYPLNPQIEQLADQDGILLWSEVPVYQSQSQFFRQQSWLRSAHAFLRDNILDNQNHPSILLVEHRQRAADPAGRRRGELHPGCRGARAPARSRRGPSGWRSRTGPESDARAPTRRST